MTVLSKLNDILKYLLRWRKRKLYQQWVKRAGLPPEAVPQEESAGDIIPRNIIPRIDKEKLRPYLVYILLGVAIVLLCVVLILLIIQSC